MVKSLPVKPDVERTVLGAILEDENLMHSVRPVLTVDDFAEDRNKRIWRAACALYDGGCHIDYITVHAQLGESSQPVGGLAYLIGLTEGMPQMPDITAYVKILRDYNTRRRLIFLSQSIQDRAANGDDVQTILDGLGHEALSLADCGSQSGLVSAQELVDDVGISKILSPRSKRGLMGPWSWMNRKTFGLLPGELWVLAGTTSAGKTSAALQWGVHAAQHKCGTAFFSLEMEKTSIFNRAVYQISGVDSERAKADELTQEEREMVLDATNLLYTLPLYFDDTSSTVMAIHAAVRRRKLRNPIGLIVVDYLQLLGAAGRHNTRAEEVGANARALKLMASEFGCPVLLLSQFSRDLSKPGKQRKPELSDLKESGDIENHANGVWFIYRPDMDDSDKVRVEFLLPKQRDGRRNIYSDFWFFPKSQSFMEIEA